ncbi:MarR family winged helix-turn-helix transcriptional regulator [Labrys monachus]|uniref:DNA-binding MarR family transcriptional regulator n=1 Tax=Labrys monachus TaxID=217067 RepID=A0ABU0FH66_9HYPH|nr:MarR family transcriptional regulator [Labrys monachus]MDQ0393405.1 DNA-binding MarR family transcriptional regulator [Labrys monachus]
MRPTSPELCTCLAIRQAARHVSQYYDQHLAPSGLRITQFSILAKLKARGPLTINGLADVMVMDRTTLGRNILPLRRDGLIAIVQGAADRRSKDLHLTDLGRERLDAARPYWAAAQAGFDAAFGSHQGSELRALMRAVTSTDLVVETTEP